MLVDLSTQPIDMHACTGTCAKACKHMNVLVACTYLGTYLQVGGRKAGKYCNILQLNTNYFT